MKRTLPVFLIFLASQALSQECFDYGGLPGFRTVRETVPMIAIDVSDDRLCYATEYQEWADGCIVVFKRILPSGDLEGLGQFVVAAETVTQLDVVGERVAAVLGEAGVVVIDFSVHGSPEAVAHVPGVGSCTSARLADPLLLVADSEAGFRIIDLSDPDAPSETRVGGQAESVAVRGVICWVSSRYPSFFEITAWDITDPSSPERLGHDGWATSASGDQWSSHIRYYSLQIDGDLLCIGWGQVTIHWGFNNEYQTVCAGVAVFDITDPMQLIRLNGLFFQSPTFSNKVVGIPLGIDVTCGQGHLFTRYSGVLTAHRYDPSAGFIRYRVLSPDWFPRELACRGDRIWMLTDADGAGTIQYLAAEDNPRDIIVSEVSVGDSDTYTSRFSSFALIDDAVFASTRYSASTGICVRIGAIDASDPSGLSEPVVLWDQPGYNEYIAVKDHCLYTSYGVIDVVSREPIGDFRLAGRSTVHGDALYTDHYGLRIWDLAQPEAPIEVASFEVFGHLRFLAAEGDRGFAYSDHCLWKLDLTDPFAPISVWARTIDFEVEEASLRGDRLYLASADGMRIYDVAGAPTELSFTRCWSGVRDLTILEGIAYLAAGDEGLVVFDVHDPVHPVQVGCYSDGRPGHWVESCGDGVIAALGASLVLIHPDCLGVLSLEDPEAGDAPSPSVAQTALHPAYPNPFNPSTRIGYSLERPGRAVLTVHDAAGRVVRTLFDGDRAAGDHAVAWDGRDAAGRPQPAGVYFVRLRADGVAHTGKLVLVK